MINNISYSKYSYPQYSFNKNISFKSIQSLKSVDIGKCPEGYIGNVIAKKNNCDTFLKVIKKNLSEKVEKYIIKNNNNDIIGNVDIYIINNTPNINSNFVFIDDLRNFSRPNTPFFNKSLNSYYKQVGIRLLQIALKRSYESNCNGNIKLISNSDSLNWYKNIIGLEQDSFQADNMKFLHLPNKNKEFLSKLRGGL